MQMNSKSVLITGAAKRIGRGLSLALAECGYHVLIHYHTSKRSAADLAAEIKSAGGRADCVGADLSDPESVKTLFQQSRSAFGGNIDVVINNAALFLRDTVIEFDPGLAMRHFQVNAIAPMMLMQLMAAQNHPKASAINILDHIILKSPRGYSSYCISKSALSTATQLAAIQLHGKLRVNAIAPGIILPLIENESDPAWRDRYTSPPLRHNENIADIVHMVIHIIENQAISGQIIPIDSGRHLNHERIFAS